METFELLKKLHDDAIGWLKYAESKNAALAAIAAGSLYASVNLAANGDGLISVAATWATAFFLLALTMATVSFLPITNPRFAALFEQHQGEREKTNLFFFGDLADLSKNQLLERLAPEASTAGADALLMADLAEQVIVNSQIARPKLAFFECGTWLYISGLLTPVVAFLLFWISGGPTRLRR